MTVLPARRRGKASVVVLPHLAITGGITSRSASTTLLASSGTENRAGSAPEFAHDSRDVAQQGPNPVGTAVRWPNQWFLGVLRAYRSRRGRWNRFPDQR